MQVSLSGINADKNNLLALFPTSCGFKRKAPQDVAVMRKRSKNPLFAVDKRGF
jgi:hypothetical protein